MTTKFQHAGLDWIPHTPGDLMPCPGDTKVRVLLRCDLTSEVTCRPDPASLWFWGKCMDPSADLIGWHPVEEQPDPAAELAKLREENARLREWRGLSDAGLHLRLGEMTAQEIRTVRAVLNAILSEETVNAEVSDRRAHATEIKQDANGGSLH